VKDVLATIEQWFAQGSRVATAVVVETERSTPRPPGAVFAVSDAGEVAGSVSGGCIEGAVYQEAREVLAGGPPRLRSYGITDAQALEVGLPCGGTVHVFVDLLDPDLFAELAEAIRAERPVALEIALDAAVPGRARLVEADAGGGAETAIVEVEGRRVFVASYAPRPRMYVFGATAHGAAVARLGRFLGYRVTVCDARARFVTAERFPHADELAAEWPDRFLAGAQVDERTAVVVLTHDHKFDVPLLQEALASPAGYIGALGSRRTTAERAELLREAGVADEDIERIHAPIGLSIGARSPEEIAIAIAAELVSVRSVRRSPSDGGPRRRAHLVARD